MRCGSSRGWIQKSGYFIAKPIFGHEYRGIEALCANSNSQFVRRDLILE